MLEGGIYSREVRNAYKNHFLEKNKCNTGNYQSINFASVLPAFILLIFGMMASLTVLVIERTIFNIRNTG